MNKESKGEGKKENQWNELNLDTFSDILCFYYRFFYAIRVDSWLLIDSD